MRNGDVAELIDISFGDAFRSRAERRHGSFGDNGDNFSDQAFR